MTSHCDSHLKSTIQIAKRKKSFATMQKSLKISLKLIYFQHWHDNCTIPINLLLNICFDSCTTSFQPRIFKIIPQSFLFMQCLAISPFLLILTFSAFSCFLPFFFFPLFSTSQLFLSKEPQRYNTAMTSLVSAIFGDVVILKHCEMFSRKEWKWICCTRCLLKKSFERITKTTPT